MKWRNLFFFFGQFKRGYSLKKTPFLSGFVSLAMGVRRGGQHVFPSYLKLKVFFCVLLKYEFCVINSELVMTNIMHFDITG